MLVKHLDQFVAFPCCDYVVLSCLRLLVAVMLVDAGSDHLPRVVTNDFPGFADFVEVEAKPATGLAEIAGGGVV